LAIMMYLTIGLIDPGPILKLLGKPLLLLYDLILQPIGIPFTCLKSFIFYE
jgi:hypothetical protein